MRALVVLTLLASSLPCAALAAPVHRFALLVGHNDGGPGTAPLRYAESDTKKLAGILKELGGLADEDTVVLLGRPAEELQGALDRLDAKIRDAKATEQAQTTLLLYYSGHGKGGDLRLGRSVLSMKAFRERLARTSADVKLGIVDSCESGVVTREKGGRRGPSFLLDSDDRELGRGLVLITSSSANEASQESDELGGSFFTHYLASGLRGDADESGDRKVTLGEVYAYAYNKTVSVTASTRSGTQHPTYSYELKGNGDLVLTDLTQGAAGVSFGAPLGGDYLVFDVKHESVAAEVRKEAGTPRRIALPPGEYVVKKRLPDHLRMARFALAARGYYEVDEAKMARVEFEDDYAKGALDVAGLRHRTRYSVRATAVFQSFFSGSVRRELFPSTGLLGVGLEVGPILGGRLGGDVLFGGQKQQVLELGGLALGYDFSEVEVALGLLWGAELGDFTFSGGPGLAGIYLRRAFPGDDLLARHPQDYFTLSPGVIGKIAYFPGAARDLGLELTSRVGYFSFSVDENRSLFFGELGLVLSYRL